MDDIGDDDHLFDDGFGELNDNALFELEQNALLSTQKPADEPPGPRLHSDGPTGQNSPLQKGRIGGNDPSYRQNNDLQNSHHRQRPGQFKSHSLQEQPDLSGGFLDEGSLPTPVEGKISFIPNIAQDEVSQRELFRLQRFAPATLKAPLRPSMDYQRQPPTPYDNNHRRTNEDQDMLLEDEHRRPAANAGSEVAQALRGQIQELLNERDNMTKDLHAANSSLQAQRGEISIIRANQVKATKTYDRQLAVLKKAADDEAAKHKAEVEATRKESERIATENRFLKQDLTEEAKRVKGLQQNLRDKSKDAQGASPISTPKKTKVLPHRDGFDEEDIRMVSPSKSARKQKKTTPTVGNKRKRPNLNDSPIAPLVLDETHDLGPGPGPFTENVQKDDVPRQRVVEVRKEDGLKFLQRVNSYHPLGSSENILEVLAKYAFPSDPKTRFSSIVIEDSSRLRGDHLSIDYAKIIVSLWSRSLREKYYAPVALLMDVVKYVIALDSVKIAPVLVPDLLPVLQASGKINGIPRFEHSPVSRVSMGKFKFTPRSSLTAEVNATSCLEILLDLAYACLHDDDHINLFWQTMDIDFVLIMLNSSQPIEDMTLNLNLLATSIRQSTFGNIVAVEEEQATIEKHIIERVTCLLWETPRVDEGEQQYTTEQISGLRVEVMSLLSLLAFSNTLSLDNADSHGSRLLAFHPAAIGRLVRSIYDEVAALYSPEPTRELHVMIVNEGTLLFYRLLELHGHELNLHQKLQAVNGGVQKHAVVLTRLAFRDGPLMEEGIADETCMMAHEMLEQVITPEEAEALLEVFPTQRSKR